MNTNRKYPLNFWIGLAQVRAADLKILGAQNAFVNVVAVADNENAFKQKVSDALLERNLNLKKLEEVDLLSNRVEKFEVDRGILMLAENLFTNKDQVRFSTFHTYD